MCSRFSWALLIVGMALAIHLASGVPSPKAKSDKQKLFRVARMTFQSFPYSLAYMRMMRPAPSSIRPLASYQWLHKAEADNELAELIDSIDGQAIGDRERRSTGPVYKRYACRFKFCRIFDA
uniref:Neuropeptide-Like Protein n=1 Tax=Bursaphelenchus xylophilus TaxID=6326 RepID=A0A1I7SLU6_BURXY